MLLKPIQMAHQMVAAVVNTGDAVVDATLGNGHDALFLAGLVGEEGKVIGFDVQEAAVESSTQLFESKSVEPTSYEFHCAGHEQMASFVPEGVAAVMFNLGYLPSADKSVITLSETTLNALEVATQLLKVGGVISVMCYPGHAGGDAESDDVRRWASGLKRENFRVFQYGMLNAPNNPPFLVVIEKQA